MKQKLEFLQQSATRFFAERSAKVALFFIALKVLIDVVTTLMPYTYSEAFRVLSGVLTTTILCLWVWGVAKSVLKKELESGEEKRIAELTEIVGAQPFFSLGIVVFTALVEALVIGNVNKMNLIQVLILDVCVLGFIIAIGETSGIVFRILTARRSRSTHGILRVLTITFFVWSLLVCIDFAMYEVEGAVFVLIGVLSGLWAFVRTRKIQWHNSLTRSAKIALMWKSGVAIIVCIMMAGLVHDGYEGSNSGLEAVFHGVSLYVTLVYSIAGGVLTRLFISLFFSLPTAHFVDRRNYEVESLIELNRLALSETSIETIVETIMFRAAEATKAHAAWCEALSPDTQDYIVLASVNLNEEHIAWFHRFAEFEKKVLRSQEQILIANLDDDKELAYLTKFPNPLARSVLAIPLFSGAKRVAVLVLIKNEQYGFQNDDLRLLRAFQHNVKIAFDNARLLRESIENERIKKELSVASSIQQNLLPRNIPDIQGFDIDIKCVPAAEVGGDYYDFVKLKNGKWCLLIGDVSGKGIPAAFYMAHVKGVVFTLAGLAETPHDFLAKVNNALYGNMEKHAYITMCACMFDTDNKELVIARAGHCPTFLKQSRAVAVLTPKGLGIGLASETMFTKTLQELHVQYNEGDLVYFFTDGVSEAKNPRNEEMGYEPILDVLRSAQEVRSSTEINHEIMEHLQTFTSGAQQHDDITSVVVRCLPVENKSLNTTSVHLEQTKSNKALLEEHNA